MRQLKYLLKEFQDILIGTKIKQPNLEGNNKEKPERNEIFCSYCNEKFCMKQIKKHEETCKMFSQLFEKLPDGYQCLVCSMMITTSSKPRSNTRSDMYCHIKISHLDKKGKFKKASKLVQNLGNKAKKDLVEIFESNGNQINKIAPKMPLTKTLNNANKAIEPYQNIETKNDKEKKECENCHELVLKPYHLRHERACKRYKEFILRTATSYQCKLCTFEISLYDRICLHKMNLHIKKKHPKMKKRKIPSKIDLANEVTEHQNVPKIDEPNENKITKIAPKLPISKSVHINYRVKDPQSDPIQTESNIHDDVAVPAAQ